MMGIPLYLTLHYPEMHLILRPYHQFFVARVFQLLPVRQWKRHQKNQKMTMSINHGQTNRRRRPHTPGWQINKITSSGQTCKQNMKNDKKSKLKHIKPKNKQLVKQKSKKSKTAGRKSKEKSRRDGSQFKINAAQTAKAPRLAIPNSNISECFILTVS